jgi:POT family proton-dependent oligopeptide transporter
LLKNETALEFEPTQRRDFPSHPSHPPQRDSMTPTYRTSPESRSDMPSGIPYIIGNEAAERFSFYGMRTILVVFMTQYLLKSGGELSVMRDAEANSYYHQFMMAVYFFPTLGALLSDGLLGKYRTILWLSIVYCLGHLCLALDETRVGLFFGLILIAIGSGGIKPCVSANVGDQFGPNNQHLLEKMFGWFYFSINLGAFASTILTPRLLRAYGPHVAFGVPGILMLLATIVFWLGRNKFVHVPPPGWKHFQESFSGEGLRALGRLCSIYVFVAVFWCLFDQTGSSWVLQAGKMDHVWLGLEILPDQAQAANPLLILLYIPLFTYGIYPALNAIWPLTPLRKVSIGFFVTALAFAIPALVQQRIDAGAHPSIGWQLLAYAVITAAEVMVSITCLEFSYTQAPRTMKSVVMSLYMLSVALGNLMASVVNEYIDAAKGTSWLEGQNYYWFFTGLMLAASLAFIVVAANYRGRTYLQE